MRVPKNGIIAISYISIIRHKWLKGIKQCLKNLENWKHRKWWKQKHTNVGNISWTACVNAWAAGTPEFHEISM